MDEVKQRRVVQTFNVKNDLGGKSRFRSSFATNPQYFPLATQLHRFPCSRCRREIDIDFKMCTGWG